MFKVGDYIVYGATGVCRVNDITTPDIGGASKSVKYYQLRPLYQNGTIYAPVDSDKVFMRGVITKDEALELIDMIPTVEAEAFHSRSVQELSEHYREAIGKHDCADLIELVMSIYSKKQFAESRKQKFGQVDERFMKRAEDLLYGEFSVALGIPKDNVREFIAERVGAMEDGAQ